MKDISKTLIIGLGGTGQRVICDIKKRMLRTYGEIPSLVKFLEFDTDDLLRENMPFKYYHEGYTFEDFKSCIQNNEFYRIPIFGLDEISRDPVCSEKLDLKELGKVMVRLVGKGTAGYRVAGRASFLRVNFP